MSFSTEEKVIISKCNPAEHMVRGKNNNFTIIKCPVAKCRLCLLFEMTRGKNESIN